MTSPQRAPHIGAIALVVAALSGCQDLPAQLPSAPTATVPTPPLQIGCHR